MSDVDRIGQLEQALLEEVRKRRVLKMKVIELTRAVQSLVMRVDGIEVRHSVFYGPRKRQLNVLDDSEDGG